MKTLSAALIIFVMLVQISSASFSQGAVMSDRFEDIYCNDEKARLDGFTIQLQNQPDAIGYVVFYGGRRYGKKGQSRLPRRNEAEARVARLKSYLVDLRGLDPKRVVIVNGGYRETWQAELWVVPTGATQPVPKPTLKPEQIKFRKGVAREKEYECGV